MQTEQQQFVILLLVVFLGFIGSYITYPIFPPLFLYPNHDAIIPFDWSDDTRKMLLGLTLAAYPLGQFLGSPILGRWSDNFGRKPILIASLLGNAVGYALLGIALKLNILWLLFFSRLLTGFMESNLVILWSMAADLTSIDKYKSFGQISAASDMGYIAGPLVGGYFSQASWISWFSPALPLFMASVFSGIAMILAFFTLHETAPIHKNICTFRQQFNVIHQLKTLFNNKELKYLLIVSSIFTLSVDIFYEFGPVYLTGTWLMTPERLAAYNTILSMTLALGSAWLPSLLARSFMHSQIVIFMITATGIIFGCIILWPSQLWAFSLFGLSGLTIAAASTYITIQLSNTVSKDIQGEAMGSQLSLRMLGDFFICLFGGFLIIKSVATPLMLANIIALFAAIIYFFKFHSTQTIIEQGDS